MVATSATWVKPQEKKREDSEDLENDDAKMTNFGKRSSKRRENIDPGGSFLKY